MSQKISKINKFKNEDPFGNLLDWTWEKKPRNPVKMPIMNWNWE